MDRFLKEINAAVFLEYVKSFNYPDMIEVDAFDDGVQLKTPYSKSEIKLHQDNIFEMSVVNSYTRDNEFYLHFQMNNLKHAQDLFDEMLSLVKELVNKPVKKILLSCTGGLTTGFFALQLNDVSEMLKLDYYFDAVAFDEIEDVINQYSILLLAPQIAYKQAELQLRFPNKLIINMPPKVFARYDTGKLIELIKETEIKNETDHKENVDVDILSEEHGEILTMAIIRNSDRIHVDYQLYGRHNELLDKDNIIKYSLSLNDLFDVIDMIFMSHKHIDVIALSLPGIVNEGKAKLMSVNGMPDYRIDFSGELTRRYHTKVVLANDVNAVAVGYHATQDKYHNLTALFQPITTHAGIGHIINDELLVGHCACAGEVQFLPMNLSASRLELNKTVNGSIELLTQECLAIISQVAPELIVVFNQFLPSIERLKEELIKYIPEEYFPDFVRPAEMQSYSYIGLLILSIKELSKKRYRQ